MAAVNKVILLGNVGRDPEIRYMPDGKAVANFSLATSETWKDKTTGEKKESTEWHRIDVFDPDVYAVGDAVVVRDYVTKGKQLYIEGSLRTEEWTDKDGIKRKTTTIRVAGPNSRVVLLGSKGDSPAPKQEGFQASDDDVPF